MKLINEVIHIYDSTKILLFMKQAMIQELSFVFFYKMFYVYLSFLLKILF